MSVKLLTEHDLEFLSLKGGCTGSSESTLVKMPHCWKSHVTAHLSLRSLFCHCLSGRFTQVLLYFILFFRTDDSGMDRRFPMLQMILTDVHVEMGLPPASLYLAPLWPVRTQPRESAVQNVELVIITEKPFRMEGRSSLFWILAKNATVEMGMFSVAKKLAEMSVVLILFSRSAVKNVRVVSIRVEITEMDRIL